MPLIDPALARSGCIPGSLQEHTVGKDSSKSKANSGLISPQESRASDLGVIPRIFDKCWSM